MIKKYVLQLYIHYVRIFFLIKQSLRRRRLLEPMVVSLILLIGLVAGGWFGWQTWTDRREAPPKKYTVRSAHKPKASKAPPKLSQADAARARTRRVIAADRSNVDCAKMKCIALTYDDGPSPYTNELLDILKSRRAVATFFVLGKQAHKYQDVLRRTHREQSEIGNHTWNHPQLTRLSPAAMTQEIQQTDQAIWDITGAMPRLVRPPYAAYNPQVAATALRPLALWSIDMQDWRNRNPDMIYQHVVANAHPGGVVVLHDIHATTIHATPRIVDELQRQGYILVTMSELFGITDTTLPKFYNQILRKR